MKSIKSLSINIQAFFVFSLYFFIFLSPLVALITEMQTFKELPRYVETPLESLPPLQNPSEEVNILVVLDIDDTLLIPSQTLGCDVWFRERLQVHQASGLASRAALDKALGEWEAVRHLTDIEIVEKGTAEIIQTLQDKSIPMIGLTTQALTLASRTNIQLNSVGIDLLKTAPSREELYFQNPLGVLYRGGVLYTAGTKKGEALLKLLKIIDFHPTHVIFVNDKETHLKDMEGPLTAEKIHFTGLRYAYSDEKITHYSSEIADVQWRFSCFAHILSDKEAEEILHTKKMSAEK